jgi:hypothetical protein
MVLEEHAADALLRAGFGAKSPLPAGDAAHLVRFVEEMTPSKSSPAQSRICLSRL